MEIKLLERMQRKARKLSPLVITLFYSERLRILNLFSLDDRRNYRTLNDKIIFDFSDHFTYFECGITESYSQNITWQIYKKNVSISFSFMEQPAYLCGLLRPH